MIWGKTHKKAISEEENKRHATRADGTNCFIIIPITLKDGRWIWWQRAFGIQRSYYRGKDYYINRQQYLDRQ